MIIRYSNTVDSGSPEKDDNAAESQAGADKNYDCRCKEASKMSPGELLKLMMSDLAFWKKMKTPRS